MKPNPMLKNMRHLLQQKIILMDETTRQVGEVSQFYLHPTKGILLGVAIRLETDPTPLLVALRYLLCSDLQPETEQVAVLTDSFSMVEEFEAGVTTYQDFLGAEIVTDEGRLCGRIKEVYFREDNLQTIYQVKRPGLFGFLRPSYFVLGSEGDYYSHRRRRLILPHGMPQFDSLAGMAEYLPPAPAPTLVGLTPYSQNLPNTRQKHFL